MFNCPRLLLLATSTINYISSSLELLSNKETHLNAQDAKYLLYVSTHTAIVRVSLPPGVVEYTVPPGVVE